MPEKMVTLVRDYPELFNELTARETVLRMNFDTEQRRGSLPFFLNTVLRRERTLFFFSWSHWKKERLIKFMRWSF